MHLAEGMIPLAQAVAWSAGFQAGVQQGIGEGGIGFGPDRLSVEAAGLRSIPRYVELFAEAFPEQAPAESINKVNAGPRSRH